jgi:hypothetical protein
MLGLLAMIGASRSAVAQQSDQDDQDTLKPRGAPTGRVGAATRGMREGAENVTLDLVAPSQGVGLTASDRPTLCYLLSGDVSGPLRLTISMRGQAKPMADLELPRPLSRFGVIDLRDHNVRLIPGQLYVWSVALRLDPKAPSRDLVASALILYKPGDPAFEKALREASPEQQHVLFDQNNYWYDEVALAARTYARDSGSALTDLLRKAGLQNGTPTKAAAH